jgi:trehalose 6-phosphate phosphatase
LILDGTLAGIQPHPDDVVVPDSAQRICSSSRLNEGALALISGAQWPSWMRSPVHHFPRWHGRGAPATSMINCMLYHLDTLIQALTPNSSALASVLRTN